MARNNHYLDFTELQGLISLVDDNYVDNNLKEMLVYVYFGSIVNNQPKNISDCIYPKYSVTLNPYHTCHKLCISSF